MSMSDYWFRDRTKSEDSGTHLMRYFDEVARWEQRYRRFSFHLASWNTKSVVALLLESERPVSPSWRAQGISSQFLAFGVPFGEARGSIACLSVMSYHDHLPSASFLKDLQHRVIAAGFPWGWEAGPPKWWNEKKKGQLLLPWPETEELELRCQSPKPDNHGFFPLCSTCYAFEDAREQEGGIK